MHLPPFWHSPLFAKFYANAKTVKYPRPAAETCHSKRRKLKANKQSKQPLHIHTHTRTHAISLSRSLVVSVPLVVSFSHMNNAGNLQGLIDEATAKNNAIAVPIEKRPLEWAATGRGGAAVSLHLPYPPHPHSS